MAAPKHTTQSCGSPRPPSPGCRSRPRSHVVWDAPARPARPTCPASASGSRRPAARSTSCRRGPGRPRSQDHAWPDPTCSRPSRRGRGASPPCRNRCRPRPGGRRRPPAKPNANASQPRPSPTSGRTSREPRQARPERPLRPASWDAYGAWWRGISSPRSARSSSAT